MGVDAGRPLIGAHNARMSDPAKARQTLRIRVLLATAAIVLAAILPLQDGRVGVELPPAQMDRVVGTPGSTLLGFAPVALALAAAVAVFRAHASGGPVFVLLASGVFVLVGALIPALGQLGPPARSGTSRYWGSARLPIIPMNVSFLLLCLVTLYVAERARRARSDSWAARVLAILGASAFVAGLGMTEVYAAGGAADLFLLDYPPGLGSNTGHKWILRCLVIAAAIVAAAGLINGIRRVPHRHASSVIKWGFVAVAVMAPVAILVLIQTKAAPFGVAVDSMLQVYGVLALFGASLEYMFETAWGPSIEEVFA